MFTRFMDFMVNKQRLFRRMVLIWSMALITYLVFIVADHKLLIEIGAPGATVITAVIGILTTVISFYQWHRNTDDLANIRKTEERSDGD